MTAQALRIYLQDHHAASVAGTALARRVARAEQRSPAGPQLASIARAVAEDKQTLERVMAQLDVPPSRVKGALAAAGERVGRLKPNGQLRGRAPLSPVLELELLMTGITGKRALWRSLALAQPDEARLSDFDFDALAASAEEQRQQVDGLRERAAADALTGGDGRP